MSDLIDIDELKEQARKHGMFLLPINQKRGYTEFEVSNLRMMAVDMTPIIEICIDIQRTPNSAMKKLREIGVVKFIGDYYFIGDEQWMHFSEFQDAKDKFERLYPKIV